MATADNLFNMTQNFLTPDIVQKFSGILGQPADKIQSGLKSILPTFLMGLVNKGTTTEGAQSLVNLVQKEGFDSTTAPSNLADESYLKKGSDAVNGIFGNNLSSVTSTLSSTTGLNTSSITKMMGMIAPVAMGILGSKIKREGLSASGLSGFLGQQKSNLASMLPAGIGTFFSGAASNVGSAASSVRDTLNRPRHVTKAGNIPTYDYDENKKKPWGLYTLIALIVLGALWWMMARRPVEVANQVSAPVVSSATQITETEYIAPAASLGELETFLKNGDESLLPKRFAFQNLTFATGTASLGTEATNELDSIAQVLKDNPAVTARIEGFTDNTGNATTNTELSAARSEAVKQQLTERGIDGARLEAIGRGSEGAVASNNDEAGRAQNRRIEFIITNLK